MEELCSALQAAGLFWCELFRRKKQQERARSLELQAAYFEESEQLLKWLPNNPLAARNKWP